MALAILDGNQSATTLSTIVVSSAHIPAHTVVSLGTQAITDIVNATSAGLTNTQLRASAVTVGGTVTIGNSLTIDGGTITIGAGISQIGSVTASISGTIPISISSVTIGNSITISSLPSLVAGTAQIGSVTASISGTIPISISSVTIGNSITISNFPATQAISIASVTIGNTVTVSGTVTSNLGLMESVVATEGLTASSQFVKIGGHQDGSNATAHIAHVSAGGALKVDGSGSTQPISISSVTVGNSVTIGSALPAGTNRIGVVTIGGGTVTIGAGTAQIGSVTASISGTVPVSGTFFQATQPVSLASLPTLAAGTAQIGSVTASISNFPATQAISISSVTIGNTVTMMQTKASTATVTTFSATTSTQVVASNANRLGLTIFNSTANALYIRLGSTAVSSSDYSFALGEKELLSLSNITTQIMGIYSMSGTAFVTELS